MTANTDAPDGELFLNRELSQLEFNFRVLAQAQDKSIPLLERLKYLCIACTNLDEFFEVRVATVLTALEFGAPLLPDRMDPKLALAKLHSLAGKLVDEQYRLWNDDLRPALNQAGIRVPTRDSWTAKQKRWLKRYFNDEVSPVLSPLGLDPAHPFPRILNKSLNVVVVLEGKDAFGRKGGMAIVRAPRSLPRIIQFPEEISGGKNDFVFLSAVLTAFIDDLFPGMKVKGAYQFRVTRNSELFVDEEEVENLASALKGELLSRGFQPAVRLEIADNCPKSIVKTLLQNFDLEQNAVYRINGPVNLNRVIQVYDLSNRPELKFPSFKARRAKLDDEAPFDTLRERDVLLHHPYESFRSVLDLLQAAANDPQVLAIKQTLYRTSGDSPIVDALIDAAEAGKQVVVLVEITARFDEQANIKWARALEKAGCHVVYGLVGLKTHCKTSLVVRQEKGQLRRYAHIGTGNYNPKTARVYEDLGLLTADPEVGADLTDLFNTLTGYSRQTEYRRLMVAPHGVRSGLIRRIEAEAQHARAGRPSRIRLKANSIVDEAVIDALYGASRAGVPVELVVRGICALKPGVPGMSETIAVRSIVGRFLEHSRVMVFGTADRGAEHWLGSADLMHRNLDRRVETLVRVKDPLVTGQIDAILDRALSPLTRHWALHADGSWEQRPEAGAPFRDMQTDLVKRTNERDDDD